MKQFAMAVLAIVILGGSARAGVVVEEHQTTDRGMGAPTNDKITVMVQGNKQKYVIGDGKQSSITDLDSGKRIMMIDARKAYVEWPFPPKGMTPPNGKAPDLSFKKTGGHQTIAGYACDDYSGSGTLAGGDLTVNGCFSTSAPGADSFTAFQKTMTDKVKGTPLALMSDAPAGVPLTVNTTLKFKTGGRPPTSTHMTVASITKKDLPADTFLPPKDYKQQQIPMMMGGGMGPRPMAPGGAAASSPHAPLKVPE
jgi:hypothetical protein